MRRRRLLPLIAALAAAAAAQAPDQAPPLDALDVGAARTLLDGERALLLATPTDPRARLAHLRALHLMAVLESDSLPRARAELAWLRARRALPADLDSAWEGALLVVSARHGLWPPARLRDLRAAARLLDGAVRRDPDRLEIRYLRLVSGYHLPSMFRRGAQVRDDFRALARLLPGAEAAFSPTLQEGVVSFVLRRAPDLDPAQVAALRRSLAAVRARPRGGVGGRS